MRNDTNTLRVYCSAIYLLYSKHEYDKAEAFLRGILFDAYRDGLTSDAKTEVEKAIREEIEKLHAFDEKLCKKDVGYLEKHICKLCEFRPSDDSEVVE